MEENLILKRIRSDSLRYVKRFFLWVHKKEKNRKMKTGAKSV